MSAFDFIYQKLFKNKIDYYKQEVIKNHLVIKHGYDKKNSSFTGSVIDRDGDIVYYLCGKISREDGPAIIHRYNRNYYWYYKSKCHGANDEFTEETWKEKLEELKYLESLEIFK